MSESDKSRSEPAMGRYDILGVIAQSGTGAVYRAMDTTLGWEVVVKALDARFGPGSTAARQFNDAARIMGQLQHPGIPVVNDMGTLPDGRPFFVMRLIRGRTLQDVVDEGSDPVAERVRLLAVFELVCQTVGYAHYRGVAHLALKPEHVIIGAFGEVQVLGWGAARAFGGPPPEQVSGVVPDCRSDVFSVGEMLCTILTGRGSEAEQLDRCEAEPGLVALTKWCLNPDPANRPPDACVVASRITELRHGTG